MQLLRAAQRARGGAEAVAALLVVAELVEARAAGREQHDVAGPRERARRARSPPRCWRRARPARARERALERGAGLADQHRRARARGARVGERARGRGPCRGRRRSRRASRAKLRERAQRGRRVGGLRVVDEGDAARARHRARGGAAGRGSAAQRAPGLGGVRAERRRREQRREHVLAAAAAPGRASESRSGAARRRSRSTTSPASSQAPRCDRPARARRRARARGALAAKPRTHGSSTPSTAMSSARCVREDAPSPSA